ncbi:MAG: hypothetical protein KR126chlam6_00748 [Candidatus Anoxychlamydiales bacterium]|nr:hypothetical protein [Candidatus Anoxychlamydiales bacterium]
MATSVDGNKFDIVGGLPDEIAVKVLEKLNPNDLGKCSQVCRRWRALADSNDVWKQFVPDSVLQDREVTNYKKYVVERSISEDKVTNGIKRFIKSIQINEIGFLEFGFLHEEEAKLVISYANILERYNSDRDGDFVPWLSAKWNLSSPNDLNSIDHCTTKKVSRFIQVAQSSEKTCKNISMPFNNLCRYGDHFFLNCLKIEGSIPLTDSEIHFFQKVIFKYVITLFNKKLEEIREIVLE